MGRSGNWPYEFEKNERYNEIYNNLQKLTLKHNIYNNILSNELNNKGNMKYLSNCSDAQQIEGFVKTLLQDSLKLDNYINDNHLDLFYGHHVAFVRN